MMTDNAPSDPKAELRARIRAARKAIPLAKRADAEEAIAARITALPAVKQARSLGVYHAIGSEAGLDKTVRELRAFDQSPSIAYPFVISNKAMLFARFDAGDDLSLLDDPKKRQTGFDLKRVLDPRDIDILLVPGIAFDGRGRRLGQGGGYYDRYLPHLRPDAITIGIAFDEQIVGEVPHSPHDRSVGYIVTPTRLITAS